MPTGQVTHIGLLLDFGAAYGRGIVRGAYSYAVDHHLRWYFHTLQQGVSELDVLANRWHARGIIGYVGTPALLKAARELSVPVVNIGGALRETPGIPRVTFDNIEIGRMAARHLLEAGFRRFAFLGIPEFLVSECREEGFREVLAKAGYTHAHRDYSQPDFEDAAGGAEWSVGDAGLRDWLTAQEFPIAIFVNHDILSFRVSTVCRLSGIRVPEDVALLGVDNDDVICNLSYPQLSSIDTGPDRLGYMAASVLAGLMAGGRRRPSETMLLPPVRVVTRGSSERAHHDPALRTALRYIREHAHEQISVDGIAEHVMVTRRTLERLFKKELGRSVLREITRARIELAKTQLRTTANPIRLIAVRCGFLTPQRFCEVFRLSTGVTPGVYRQQSQDAVVPADDVRSGGAARPARRKGD